MRVPHTNTILFCVLSFVSSASSSSTTTNTKTPIDVQHPHRITPPSSSSSLSSNTHPAFKSPSFLTTKTTQLTQLLRGGSSTSTSSFETNLPITTKQSIIFGMILAFNSGCINGICLSGLLAHDGTKQASAAVTGAWTNSALSFATGKKDQFLFHTKCILSYMLGSFIASHHNPHPVPFEVDPIGVPVSLVIASIMLVLSSTMNTAFSTNMVWLYLAAIANGIQNSVTSVTTGNMVRSAHFSGITSDIGTFLGQVLHGNKTNLLKLQVMSLLALSFWTGGLGSYWMADRLGSQSLLFSAGVYMAVAVVVIVKALTVVVVPEPMKEVVQEVVQDVVQGVQQGVQDTSVV